VSVIRIKGDLNEDQNPTVFKAKSQSCHKE